MITLLSPREHLGWTPVPDVMLVDHLNFLVICVCCFLLILFIVCLVGVFFFSFSILCPMLSVSLECPFQITSSVSLTFMSLKNLPCIKYYLLLYAYCLIGHCIFHMVNHPVIYDIDWSWKFSSHLWHDYVTILNLVAS